MKDEGFFICLEWHTKHGWPHQKQNKQKINVVLISFVIFSQTM